MKERPILFSGEMVRAILAGRKTQTRRVITHVRGVKEFLSVEGDLISAQEMLTRCPGNAAFLMPHSPYGIHGDHLWVRETFFYEWPTEDPPDDMRECRIVYRADEPDYIDPEMREAGAQYRWSPSIFMPRWASRITLEVTGVRGERVQDITQEDALAEGIESWCKDRKWKPESAKPKYWFMRLWDSINAKRGYGWDANPWVWVVEFRSI